MPVKILTFFICLFLQKDLLFRPSSNKLDNFFNNYTDAALLMGVFHGTGKVQD